MYKMKRLLLKFNTKATGMLYFKTEFRWLLSLDGIKIHVTHHLTAFYLFTAGFISYDTIAIEIPQ